MTVLGNLFTGGIKVVGSSQVCQTTYQDCKCVCVWCVCVCMCVCCVCMCMRVHVCVVCTAYAWPTQAMPPSTTIPLMCVITSLYLYTHCLFYINSLFLLVITSFSSSHPPPCTGINLELALWWVRTQCFAMVERRVWMSVILRY